MAKGKKSFAEILSGMENAEDRKMQRKLPSWAGISERRAAEGLDRLEIPSSLALQQCSSDETALYKLSVLQRVFPSGVGTAIDLCCGLGRDSAALTEIAENVIAFERDSALAEADRRNFARLGLDRIEVRCEEVGPDTEIPECGLVFADPARRSGTGTKVFRLEDCSPNLIPLLPGLLRKARYLLFKLSPMADVRVLSEAFGRHLREVHIVGLRGEVKELLCLLSGEASEESFRIFVSELGSGHEGVDSSESGHDGSELSGSTFSFCPAEEKAAEAEFAERAEVDDWLVEPKGVLLKSGAFKLPCSKFALRKADVSTHLYLSCTPFRHPLFKSFRIIGILPFEKQSLRDLRKTWPRCEVSARNLPISSDELRRRLGIASGADIHVFGCTVAGKRLLVITRPETGV